jgi:hypothetical protein
MNRAWTRPIHRLAHRLDRLGWWLEDPWRARRKREALRKEAARIDGLEAHDGA